MTSSINDKIKQQIKEKKVKEKLSSEVVENVMDSEPKPEPVVEAKPKAKAKAKAKPKAKAKAKFDVYPSAYANAYMVKEYKRMGGRYAAEGGAIRKNGGGDVSLKEIPKNNKGLGKLPTKVRNRMGYMNGGGTVNKNITMVQGRGCGAIDPSKQKKTRVPRT